MINILPLLFIDDIYAGQCDEISVFLGSPRSRAGKGIGEVLNGERTEIRLWQETESQHITQRGLSRDSQRSQNNSGEG